VDTAAAPGPLEQALRAELGSRTGLLVEIALDTARAVDQVPASKLKDKLSGLKALQQIRAELLAPATPAEKAAADIAEPQVEAGIFGAVRPELSPAVDFGVCTPRWATPRRLERRTWGPYWARVAEALGRPFMPWQRYAADLAGEVDETGKLCYRQVVATVPRQSGKTTIILSVVVGRAEAGKPFGGRQNMLYAAQTQLAADKKFKKEYIADLRHSEVMSDRFTTKVGSGATNITFTASDSTFQPVPTKSDSSHGEVLDFGVLDEGFAQTDDAVEGAWRPATITRPMAQLWFPSTAGDATSTWYRGKVDVGRAAAETDSGYGIAYIEFSADDKAPGFDPGDEEMWRRVMPALGHTQTVEALRGEYQTLVQEGKLTTWLRAFLNIWVDRRSEPVFRAGKWEACHQPDVKRVTRPVLAVDVSADRRHATIAMGSLGSTGVPMVRVLDYRPGTEWVIERLLELKEKQEVAAVVLDAAGPARSLIPELENNYIRHHVTTTQEMAGACGMFYDAVDQGALAHLSDPALELAVTGAETRPLLDSWAWTRKKSAEETKTDISPLVACTLAHWAQLRFGDQEIYGDDAW